MTKKTKTRRCAVKAKILSTKDSRITENQRKKEKEEKAKKEALVRHVEQTPSSMFFKLADLLYSWSNRYNTALGPPFRILIDTNFINFSLQNKLDIMKSLMDCLLAKCIPYITDCVMAELEKLGSRYHVALRLAKDPRFQRLTCSHKGTYADDCIVERVRTVNSWFVCSLCRIVATSLPLAIKTWRDESARSPVFQSCLSLITDIPSSVFPKRLVLPSRERDVLCCIFSLFYVFLLNYEIALFFL